MGLNVCATYEEESDEEGEGESSGDESYDYGFAEDDDDDDEDDGDYEVDFTNMNVSPEILRMLGASEDVVAAKEAEVSGVTSTWVPPTETGLEHSAAIADAGAVAIGGGKAAGGGGLERVFKAVGEFDEDEEHAAKKADVASSPTLKVKIVNSPEPVPKELESKLPPMENESQSSADGSDSGSSWDEASLADGEAWWECGSDDEGLEMAAMSPNILTALGLDKPSASTGGENAGSDSEWKPPSFSGLTNSKPLTTLMPVVVAGLEIKNKDIGGDGDEGGGDWSDEEGWDYEDIPDEEYMLEWSTNVSPNLLSIMEKSDSRQLKVEALSAGLSWKAPATSGLANSSPIFDAAQRRSSIVLGSA